MRICYINIDLKSTRDRVALLGLRENGHEVLEIEENAKGLKKFSALRRKLKVLEGKYDIAMIGYAGAILVPWVRLVSGKKIIYNAGAPLYDGMILSRNAGREFSLKALRIWLIDYVSLHLSDIVLLESEAQKKFTAEKFHVKSKKLFVVQTGADKAEFFIESGIVKRPIFTVLFRGKFMPEAGVDVLLEAAVILKNEGIRFLVLGHGFLEEEIKSRVSQLQLSNLELVTERLSFAELRRKMQECKLSLGQLSNHPRLERTIPHKAFESMAMALPYLSARTGAVLEVLAENKTCLCFEPGNAEDLARMILFAKNNPQIIREMATEGKQIFEEKYSPREMLRDVPERA